MKKLLIVTMLATLLTGCTDREHAIEAVENLGLTDVVITGHAWFACGKDDVYETGFEATNPHGKRIKGVVCAGLFFKGATVRFL